MALSIIYELVQYRVVGYIFTIIGCYVCFRMLKPCFIKLYKVTYAFLLELIGKQINGMMGSRKIQLFADMHKKAADLKRPMQILEIGAGSGGNLKFYPEGAEIYYIDPNCHFDKYQRRYAEKYPHVRIKDFMVGCAEEVMLQIEDDSFDAVAVTYALCTIADVETVLREVRRVLKPGAKFYLMEHVAGDAGTWTRTLQDWAAPVWPYLFDGCCPIKDTAKKVEACGFSQVQLERFFAHELLARYDPIFVFIKPHLLGTCVK